MEGWQIYVRGLEEAQAAYLQMMQAINPRSGLGHAVKDATTFLFRYAVTITHRITGTLAASHTMNFGTGRLTTTFAGFLIRDEAVGHIEIDPRPRNPVTGKKPRDYGPEEHARGGSHAFYERTVNEQGATALMIAHSILMGELPQGGPISSVLSVGRGTQAVQMNLLDMLGGPEVWQ